MVAPPRRVAFRSMALLGQYDLSEKYDETYLKEVILHGMRLHFKTPEDTVRVWYEVDPLGNHADVHMEMVSSSGEVLQPWLLSLCRAPIESWEAFQLPCISFKDSPSPFLEEGDFHWPCSAMTKEEVFKGLEAWAACYWPDWTPTFEDHKLEELRFFDDLEVESCNFHLISPREMAGPDVLEYLTQEGLMVVSDDSEGLVVYTSYRQLLYLKHQFPLLKIEPYHPLEDV